MDYIEMTVVSAKKPIRYEKRKGETSTMRAYTLEDGEGNKHDAVAWGELCHTVNVGDKVKVTKWFSPGRHETDIDRYIILG